jgi:hypothetical protein
VLARLLGDGTGAGAWGSSDEDNGGALVLRRLLLPYSRSTHHQRGLLEPSVGERTGGAGLRASCMRGAGAWAGSDEDNGGPSLFRRCCSPARVLVLHHRGLLEPSFGERKGGTALRASSAREEQGDPV